MPALQQDVFRLDIAVNELVLVRMGQRIGHLARDAERVVDGQLRLPPQAVAERFALDIRHHVVEEPVGLARIVERHDVRVPQPCGDPDLAQEPLGPERGCQLAMKHLECDRAVVLQVVDEVDRRHAPSPQLPHQAIARRERLRKARHLIVQ